MNRSDLASDTHWVPRQLLAVPFLVAVLALSACGSDSANPTKQKAEKKPAQETLEGPAEGAGADDLEGAPADVAVIRSWSEALTASDIRAAAELFAIPSVAENGLSFDIETKEDARGFNDSLPCGAILESTSVEGGFITATFKLTERPGVPVCPGSGNEASTSFVIEDGAIVEWRRVALPGGDSTGQMT